MSDLFSQQTLAYLLTLFCWAVVISTRVRLRAADDTSTAGLVHTGFGVFGGVLWTIFILLQRWLGDFDGFVGVVGLGAWWVTAGAGMLVLSSVDTLRGRRSRSSGRGVLARVMYWGFLVAGLYLTYAYSFRVV